MANNQDTRTTYKLSLPPLETISITATKIANMANSTIEPNPSNPQKSKNTILTENVIKAKIKKPNHVFSSFPNFTRLNPLFFDNPLTENILPRRPAKPSAKAKTTNANTLDNRSIFTRRSDSPTANKGTLFRIA